MRAQRFSVFNPMKMIASAGPVALTLALAPGASSAVTDINGLQLDLRNIWNQYPDSDLSINGLPEGSAPTQIALPALTIPGEFLRIEEGPMGDFDFGSGLSFKANSHRAWFSGDGGASRFNFQEATAFDISVDIQINSTSSAPRKEAGFFWDIGTGSDPQFIVTTDNGEVAAFAGTHPKASSVGNQGPAGLEWGGALYTPGSVATLRMIYLPPTRDNQGQLVTPGTMEYFFNGVSATGAPQPFTDIPGIGGLLPNSKLALKVQNQGTSFTNDTTDTTVIFSNLRIVNPLLAGIDGDYNNNGQVEQGDLDLVLLNWGADGTTPPSGWTNNLPTGLIDQAELDGVLLNWGNTSEPALSSGAVPEPATLGAVVLAGVATLRRRGPAAL